jgi:hypothetical protein
MRIAIVCNGRSGSTSTFYYLKCCLARERKKYDSFFEPFNFANPNRDDTYNQLKSINEIINKKNILIKTFIDSDNYPYESFKSVEDYWKWFYSFFDKIIVLERKNKRLQAESYAFHLKISKNRTPLQTWHTQKYYELTEDDENDVIELVHHLESKALELKVISDKGYPLFYYEDLFVNKDIETIKCLNEYCEIEYNEMCINGWINSPLKKVRIEEKLNKLI